MFFGSGHAFRISTVARKTLAEMGDDWKTGEDFERIPTPIARRILHNISSRFPKIQNEKTVAGLIQQVWDRMLMNPPGVGATLAVLGVHAVGFIGMLAMCVVLVLAGQKPKPVEPAPAGPVGAAANGARLAISDSIEEQVCQIVARQMNVDRSKIDLNTSLANLHADDLDLVELVMELEDHFQIQIPDEDVDAGLGAKNLTIRTFVNIVNDRLRQRTTGVDENQSPKVQKNPAPN